MSWLTRCVGLFSLCVLFAAPVHPGCPGGGSPPRPRPGPDLSGSSTAYFLASQKSFDGNVLVVERDSTYEHAPSARAIGGIRQQFSTPENILIGLFGAYFIKHIEQYLSVDDGAPDIGFKESGYLLLASPEALPMMHDNHAVQCKHGAEIAFQSPSELKARFP